MAVTHLPAWIHTSENQVSLGSMWFSRYKEFLIAEYSSGYRSPQLQAIQSHISDWCRNPTVFCPADNRFDMQCGPAVRIYDDHFC